MSNTYWQRLALISLCASAAAFLGWLMWLVVGYLAPVLGLFFGGWLLACLQEPLVAWVTRRTRATRSTAVACTLLCVLAAAVIVGVLAVPALQREVAFSVTNLPVQLDAATQHAASAQEWVNSWLAEHDVPLQVDIASRPDVSSV